MEATMMVLQVVSIPTRPEGRVQLATQWQSEVSNKVSIPTRPEGRVQPVASASFDSGGVVSIPTRPEGRVQLQRVAGMCLLPYEFQFPPVPKDGCNDECRRHRAC